MHKIPGSSFSPKTPSKKKIASNPKGYSYLFEVSRFPLLWASMPAAFLGQPLSEAATPTDAELRLSEVGDHKPRCRFAGVKGVLIRFGSRWNAPANLRSSRWNLRLYPHTKRSDTLEFCHRIHLFDEASSDVFIISNSHLRGSLLAARRLFLKSLAFENCHQTDSQSGIDFQTCEVNFKVKTLSKTEWFLQNLDPLMFELFVFCLQKSTKTLSIFSIFWVVKMQLTVRRWLF